MVLALLLTLALVLAPDTSDSAPRGLPVLEAGEAVDIRVDGRLDEAAWAAAAPARDFRQLEPDEGAPASERTEVRVLYGPDALYVGAMMYDREPGAIRTALTRRDETGGADLFLVAVDSYHDRQTAYLFSVTAAGVQGDGVVQGNDDDDAWDAVWDSAVRLTPEGWAAELRIPYSQLRFPAAEVQTWGINFQRVIRRRSEESFWAPFTQEQAQAGLVQYFGELRGLRGIRPRRVLQAAPYTVTRARRFEHEDRPGHATADYAYDVGADVKLGLASNWILDATVNPDFGQVEADPAELNLSTFETFFDERRPFFLEGAQIFDYTIGGRDGSMLYTRRVGGAAPIISAAKLTGRTAGGLSVGGLFAATGDDFDPRRLYGTARLKQELSGQDYVGGAVSAYHSSARTEDDDFRAQSLAGGVDWDFRLGREEAWMLEGSLAGAVRDRPGEDALQGYALYVGYDKVKGHIKPFSGLRIYSPDFALNDVGRFRQTDLLQVRGGTQYRLNQNRPFGPFQYVNGGVNLGHTWRYSDGVSRGAFVESWLGARFKGFQWVNVYAEGYGLGGYDVRETRGRGVVRNRPGFFMNLNANNDNRRRFRFGGFGNFSVRERGEGRLGGGGWVQWTATDRLTLYTEAFTAAGNNWRAWAANESLFLDDAGLSIGTEDGAPDALAADARALVGLSGADAAALLDGVAPYDAAVPGAYYVPVFGRRDTRETNVIARANVLVSPTLSLQLYGQLFAARGRYDAFQLVAGPDDFRDFAAYPKRRDFAVQAFTANAVLRWEYRRGSTLFVVWSQSRYDDVAESLLLEPGGPHAPSPYQAGTLDQLSDTFSLFPEDVFLVKLSYLIAR